MSDGEPEPRRAGGGFAAASTGGQAGRTETAPRDRDPPPAYDGENPEVTFRQYEKQVALWEFETEVPKQKRGIKLLRQLTGVAMTAVDDMEISEIACEQGVKNVLGKLREYFLPHLEVSLPRAFETAVYGPPRGNKESFAEYTKRMERAFIHLTKEGVDLPDGAKGYILYRQASLTEAQDQRLLTWAEGQYGRGEITKALRRLDKVIKEKDKPRGSYVAEETYVLENDTGINYEADGDGAAAWEDDDENYIFLADGDLDEVMDEQDVLNALASYNDTRQALKDQRLGRGFFPGKGKGKLNAFQKGKDKGKRRVHIEQLKLRTRCRKCLQVGHWERECQNPPASSAGKGEGRTFYVGLRPESTSFSSSQQDFWLRQFVKESRARQEASAEIDMEANPSKRYMERACMVKEGKVNFCGITTQAIEGIVDTAAEGGLIGKESLLRLERELAGRGLRVKWIPKQSFAKGVGGNAVVEGVALIPLGLGGINGVLETTVVQGDVPFLLPVKLLKALEVVIDLKNMVMQVPSHQVFLPLRELASGHVAVNVMSFAEGKFLVPSEAGTQGEFELESRCFATTAMPAQSHLADAQFDHWPEDASRPSPPHGVAAEEGQGLGGRYSFHGSSADGSRAAGAQSSCTDQELENRPGQNRHFAGPRSTPGRNRRMVLGLGLAAAGAQVFGDHGGLLLGGDRACAGLEAAPEQECAYDFRQHLRASQIESQRGRKWLELVHSVPSVPYQMGPFRTGSRCSEEDQGRPLEPEEPEGGTYIADEPGYIHSGTKDTVEERGENPGRCGVGHPSIWRRDFGGSDGHEAGSEGRNGHSCPDDAAAAGERTGGLHHSAVPDERGPASADRGRGEESHCGQPRARDQAGEAHADADPGQDPGGNPRSPSKLEAVTPTKGDQALPMREASRGSDRQEGRTEEGTHVLEMCPTSLRPLRMDRREGPGRHRRGEDGGLIIEPKEVQESEEGGPSVSSNGGEQLVPGVREQQPGGERAGGGCGRVRRLEDGWTRCATRSTVRWARQAQQGNNSLLEVHGNFWMKNSTGEWIESAGTIPKEVNEVYVQIRHSKRGEFQNLWEDSKSTHISRKDRQMLMAMMKKMGPKGRALSEVFCPPRVTKILKEKGYQVGTSFDLVTGWDLSRPEDRKAMWKALRAEQPEVILACPPCRAYSKMQAVNWSRMDPKKRVHLLQTGQEHLHLAIAVLRWQLRRGGAILFEHPDGATSWQDPELQSLANSSGVKVVICDQCMFGLNVDGTGPNRKRTRWLSNMSPVLELLDVKCDKSHFHVPLENGRPKLAQVYPDKLCQAISNGIVEYLNGISNYAMEEEEEDEDMAPDEPEPVQDEGPGDYTPTEEEKKAVMRVHRAVGHPQDREFIRFLRAARVRGEIVQWASKNFKCDVCESKRHPKAPRPTALPRAYQPNRVLGLDLFYVPAPGNGKQTVPVLNILDWGTNYQMCEVLSGKSPNEVWEAYMSTWARTFGHPEVITCDAGREFLGEFIQRAASEGIVIHQIASKAPWQQGKTERHGGHFKELLEKVRSEVVIQSTRDLKQIMVEVEQAKNRYSNRSGFAPVQRQIGQWPRLPTSIMSDEAVDPTLLNGVITDDLEKLHHMRTIAHKAFCEHNAKSTFRRALRARPRVWVDYKAGEYVFVFRCPE